MKNFITCLLMGAKMTTIEALDIVGGMTNGFACKDTKDTIDCYYDDEYDYTTTVCPSDSDEADAILPDNFSDLSFEEAKDKLIEVYEAEDPAPEYKCIMVV